MTEDEFEAILVRAAEKDRAHIHALPARSNDNVFYACSLIDYIARKTKNKRIDVVRALGVALLDKILDLADVYHCDNIDAVSDDFIEKAGIGIGSFDNVGVAKYAVPSHWDIGKVYKRLVVRVAKDEGVNFTEAIFNVYSNPICELIDDYNGSYYYSSSDAIFIGYKYGEID